MALPRVASSGSTGSPASAQEITRVCRKWWKSGWAGSGSSRRASARCCRLVGVRKVLARRVDFSSMKRWGPEGEFAKVSKRDGRREGDFWQRARSRAERALAWRVGGKGGGFGVFVLTLKVVVTRTLRIYVSRINAYCIIFTFYYIKYNINYCNNINM